ncbi:InaD-like protein [Larimichthys crocea]|nr:InaD-like protein [Larimichthys crocea]
MSDLTAAVNITRTRGARVLNRIRRTSMQIALDPCRHGDEQWDVDEAGAFVCIAMETGLVGPRDVISCCGMTLMKFISDNHKETFIKHSSNVHQTFMKRSSNDELSDEAELNNRNRSSNSAPKSLRESDTFKKAIAALRQTPAKVCLTVLRDEAQYRDEENLDLFKMSHVSGNSSGVVAPPSDRTTSDPPTSTSNAPPPLNNNLKSSSDITSCFNSTAGDAGVRTVDITRGVTDSLGVSIAGGKGSPLGDTPIFIAMIQANGVAAKTHRLKEGDEDDEEEGRDSDDAGEPLRKQTLHLRLSCRSEVRGQRLMTNTSECL